MLHTDSIFSGLLFDKITSFSATPFLSGYIMQPDFYFLYPAKGMKSREVPMHFHTIPEISHTFFLHPHHFLCGIPKRPDDNMHTSFYNLVLQNPMSSASDYKGILLRSRTHLVYRQDPGSAILRFQRNAPIVPLLLYSF